MIYGNNKNVERVPNNINFIKYDLTKYFAEMVMK